MRIIFIGDIYGKIGRKAVAEVLPAWKRKYKPDFVLANGENLAHGSGMTPESMREVLDAGVDCLTGGNHSFKSKGRELLAREDLPLVRPANYPPGNPGRGYLVLQSKKRGGPQLLVVNLMGRVFFPQDLDDPFRKLDEILERYGFPSPPPESSPIKGEEQKSGSPPLVGGVRGGGTKIQGILVDFHTEATSEVNAFGHYVDGRVSAVVGTHTHVGTVDTRVMHGGTAFVSDVGAAAAVDSVIGETKANIIQSFLTQQPFKHVPVETGLCNIGAVLIEIDEKTKLAKSIKRIDEQVVIE